MKCQEDQSSSILASLQEELQKPIEKERLLLVVIHQGENGSILAQKKLPEEKSICANDAKSWASPLVRTLIENIFQQLKSEKSESETDAIQG